MSWKIVKPHPLKGKLDSRCKACALEETRKSRSKKKMEKWRRMLEPNLAVPSKSFNFSNDDRSQISLSALILNNSSCSS
jgi:hypothetical protein